VKYVWPDNTVFRLYLNWATGLLVWKPDPSTKVGMGN
jgi:hypothetical protein